MGRNRDHQRLNYGDVDRHIWPGAVGQPGNRDLAGGFTVGRALSYPGCTDVAAKCHHRDLDRRGFLVPGRRFRSDDGLPGWQVHFWSGHADRGTLSFQSVVGQGLVEGAGSRRSRVAQHDFVCLQYQPQPDREYDYARQRSAVGGLFSELHCCRLLQIRDLLRRTSLIAIAWTGVVVVGLLTAGTWLLGLFKNGEFLPSLPIIWVLLIGFSFANILFWNRSLLLAFGRPHYPLIAAAVAGVIKIVLMFLLVPKFGAVMQAAALSLFFILSIGAITLEGLSGLRKAERQAIRVEGSA